MPEGGDKFSIFETYLKAMETENIFGHLHDEDLWLDVGKPESLEKAENLFHV